ncbi:hypothetical protein KIPB_001130, partial [Kipferlia bialata]|eukprot:g1130.t1
MPRSQVDEPLPSVPAALDLEEATAAVKALDAETLRRPDDDLFTDADLAAVVAEWKTSEGNVWFAQGLVPPIQGAVDVLTSKHKEASDADGGPLVFIILETDRHVAAASTLMPGYVDLVSAVSPSGELSEGITAVLISEQRAWAHGAEYLTGLYCHLFVRYKGIRAFGGLLAFQNCDPPDFLLRPFARFFCKYPSELTKWGVAGRSAVDCKIGVWLMSRALCVGVPPPAAEARPVYRVHHGVEFLPSPTRIPTMVMDIQPAVYTKERSLVVLIVPEMNCGELQELNRCITLLSLLPITINEGLADWDQTIGEYLTENTPNVVLLDVPLDVCRTEGVALDIFNQFWAWCATERGDNAVSVVCLSQTRGTGRQGGLLGSALHRDMDQIIGMLAYVREHWKGSKPLFLGSGTNVPEGSIPCDYHPTMSHWHDPHGSGTGTEAGHALEVVGEGAGAEMCETCIEAYRKASSHSYTLPELALVLIWAESDHKHDYASELVAEIDCLANMLTVLTPRVLYTAADVTAVVRGWLTNHGYCWHVASATPAIQAIVNVLEGRVKALARPETPSPVFILLESDRHVAAAHQIDPTLKPLHTGLVCSSIAPGTNGILISMESVDRNPKQYLELMYSLVTLRREVPDWYGGLMVSGCASISYPVLRCFRMLLRRFPVLRPLLAVHMESAAACHAVLMPLSAYLLETPYLQDCPPERRVRWVLDDVSERLGLMVSDMFTLRPETAREEVALRGGDTAADGVTTHPSVALYFVGDLGPSTIRSMGNAMTGHGISSVVTESYGSQTTGGEAAVERLKGVLNAHRTDVILCSYSLGGAMGEVDSRLTRVLWEWLAEKRMNVHVGYITPHTYTHNMPLSLTKRLGNLSTYLPPVLEDLVVVPAQCVEDRVAEREWVGEGKDPSDRVRLKGMASGAHLRELSKLCYVQRYTPECLAWLPLPPPLGEGASSLPRVFCHPSGSVYRHIRVPCRENMLAASRINRMPVEPPLDDRALASVLAKLCLERQLTLPQKYS